MDSLIGLSGTVMMFVEILARILVQTKIPDDLRKLILLSVSILLGVVLVVTAPEVLDDAGVKSLLGVLPYSLQVIVAGVLVGFGSKVINEVYGIANRLKASLETLSDQRKEEARAMRAGTIQFISGRVEQTSRPENASSG